MKDSTELYACSLEMKGGYHGHPYPQKFVKCPESQHPSPSPSSGKECSPREVMYMVMHGKD